MSEGGITAEELERARAQGLARASRPDRFPSGLAGTSIFADINNILNTRRGSVLDSRSILKIDYVPDVAAALLHGGGGGGNGVASPARRRDHPALCPVPIHGAKHLRRSPATRIFGTAQPSVAGIRGVLNLLGAGRASPQGGAAPAPAPTAAVRAGVLWINLREEPILYVNGRSTVLRERDEPFRNIDLLRGIDPGRVGDLERRLKEDVVEESARCGGSVVLHEEVRRCELEASWEGVATDDIRSPEEVFLTLGMQGYRVRYVRIPTTPERAPPAEFFDGVIDALMGAAPRSTVVVFNCQNGITRSTLGMVAGGLVQMWRGLIDIPKPMPIPNKAVTGCAGSDLTDAHATTGAVHGQEVRRPDPESSAIRVLSGAALTAVEEGLDMPAEAAPDDDAVRGGGDGAAPTDDAPTDDAVSRRLEAGWFRPTLALIRLLDSGKSSKRHVDHFCEDASHLVNLRSNVYVQWLRAGRERHRPAGLFRVRRAATALLRYLLLMSFDSYLASQVALLTRDGGGGADGGGAFPQSFRSWLRSRPEIANLLSSVEERPAEAMGAPDLGDSLLSGLQGDMAEALRSRHGSMLGADTILKADHFPGAGAGGRGDSSRSTSGASIRGAPNFRNIDGTRVYGVCTPSCDAASDVVRYIQASAAWRARRVVWTNLREEPVVYVGGEPYVLRQAREPFRNAGEFASIHPDRLEEAESRLKRDVLAEARRCGGRVLVHTESDRRSLRLVWADAAEEEDVLTPRELYESLAEGGHPVDYARLPQTPERPPSAADVDCIIERVRAQSSHPGAHFVFNCQLGRGRSTTAMAIALLELQRSDADAADISEDPPALEDSPGPRLDRKRAPLEKRGLGERMGGSGVVGDSDDETEVDEDPRPFASPSRRGSNDKMLRAPSSSAFDSSDASDNGAGAAVGGSSEGAESILPSGEEEFGVILSLVRVLRDGVMAKKWADSVVVRCGEVENIRRNIADCVERASTSRTTERGDEFVERGLLNLRRYFIIILVAAYEIGYDQDKIESFGAWYRRHLEIQTIYNEVKGRESLRYASVDRVLSGPPPTEQNELSAAESSAEGRTDVDASQASIFQFVARRNGMVLTRGSIIKSDHFPGCNRLKDAAVVIDGVPNFREIRASDAVEGDIGIYGTGIPTVEGLRGVLDHVSRRRRGSKGIAWINLREEPILYVNGNPYVLRKLEHPFENLEHTGISRERVENMEDRLKVDVINEVLANGSRLLVHDEDESGIKPTWLTVDISEGSTSIQTPRDLYSMLAMEYNVTQYRVPITDEQAPKIIDYDEISNIVRKVPIDTEIIFNCQMGRGRTTTGLVIASAVRLWEHSDLRSFPFRFEELVKSEKVKTRRKVGEAGLNSTAEKYLRGEYDAIVTLIRVLDEGIEAKRTIDAVIDACDSLQNLREATYAMKVASESEDKSRVQRVAALHRGVHYLRRYYQLIAFVAYLFCYSPEDRTRIKTFAVWLKERRELMSIIKRLTLE